MKKRRQQLVKLVWLAAILICCYPFITSGQGVSVKGKKTPSAAKDG